MLAYWLLINHLVVNSYIFEERQFCFWMTMCVRALRFLHCMQNRAGLKHLVFFLPNAPAVTCFCSSLQFLCGCIKCKHFRIEKGNVTVVVSIPKCTNGHIATCSHYILVSDRHSNQTNFYASCARDQFIWLTIHEFWHLRSTKVANAAWFVCCVSFNREITLRETMIPK